MRFVIDAQLPPALARWLADQGHDAEHVADRGMQSAPDETIWRYALETGATIITKDEDFARRQILNDRGPTIVWLRLPNSRTKDLIALFERVVSDLLAALERGERLIEIV